MLEKKFSLSCIILSSRKIFLASLMLLITSSGVYSAELPATKLELVGNKIASSSEKLRIAPAGKKVQGKYIVVLSEDYISQESNRIVSGTLSAMPEGYRRSLRFQVVDSTISDFVANSRVQLGLRYRAALPGFAASLKVDQLTELLNDPRVAYVEEEQIFSISEVQSDATWGLDRIDQEDLPLDSFYTYDYDGSGVDAYIIDTGILASHQLFDGRVGGGFSSISGGTGDCQGHGTHVAGTVGSTTYGVAKNVNLIPVRVLDCNGSGTTSGVIAGVDWVADNASGASVANMSLGGGISSALDQSVQNAINAGVTFVVAAGNESTNACNGSPSRVANALTIASSTSSDARSSFSNFGSCVDMFAPGSSITSTWNSSNSSVNTISGTSMASPHVAGVVALYLEQNPSASPAQVEAALENIAYTNKISSASGSPNLLVSTAFSGGSNPGPTPTPPPSGPTPTPTPTPEPDELYIEVPDLSVGRGSWLNYYLDLDGGYSSFTVSLSGGSGDADLYLNYNSQATFGNYDCRSQGSTNTEICTINSPEAGRWYIGVYGYRSASDFTLSVSAN